MLIGGKFHRKGHIPWGALQASEVHTEVCTLIMLEVLDTQDTFLSELARQCSILENWHSGESYCWILDAVNLPSHSPSARLET